MLHLQVIDFPDGHIGYATHAPEFAEQLASVLLSRLPYRPRPNIRKNLKGRESVGQTGSNTFGILVSPSNGGKAIRFVRLMRGIIVQTI